MTIVSCAAPSPLTVDSFDDAPCSSVVECCAQLKTLESKIDSFIATHGFGFCRIITKERLLGARDIVLGGISFLNTLARKMEPFVIAKITETENILLDKTALNVKIFFLFKDMAWKGSFKKLCLGLEVSETLKPIGISLLVNDPANLNELRVRSDAIINIIAPKIFFHGMLGSTPFFCHEFAHYGSCSSFLRNAVPFPILHRLMINFVDSLDDLHGLAIHRDLHVGNLVVFKTEFGFSIKINDLGTLMFKGSLESPAVMTTNSINLSPEIMKRCHSIAKAHQWDTIFDAGLSFLDWELMERFHAGIILLNIMLGKNPLRIVLEEKKPQLFIQASSFATSSEKVNFLRSYFLEVELDEIRNLYFSAFHCFYWTLLDKRADLPYNKDNTLIVPIDFAGPTLLGYPGKITFKDPQDFENLDLHEAYTAIFDEYFDSTQLSCLDSYLAPKAFSRIEEIVDRCDERLKLTPIDYNDEYARILLNLDEPLESYKGSFLKGVHPTLIAQVSTRLDIIFPLLNLDPDARAPLRWVTDHLLALKDF